jgi:hypothetical protein
VISRSQVLSLYERAVAAGAQRTIDR